MGQLQRSQVSKQHIINQAQTGSRVKYQAVKILSHRKIGQIAAATVIQLLMAVRRAAVILGQVIIRVTVLLIRRMKAAEVQQQILTVGQIISAAGQAFKPLLLTEAQQKAETFAAIHLKGILICKKQHSHA